MKIKIETEAAPTPEAPPTPDVTPAPDVPGSTGLISPSSPEGGGLEMQTFSQAEEAEPIDTDEPDETTLYEAFGATLYRSNPLFGLDDQQFDTDPEYSPWDEPDELYGYEPEAFVGSRSAAETEHIKSQIGIERFAVQELAQADGFTGILAEAGSALLNPVYAIPGIAASRIPTIVLGEVLAESVTEMALQSRQYERSMAESVMNVAGAGLFAGVVGGIAMKIGSMAEIKAGNAAAAKILGDAVEAEVDVPNFTMSPEKGSVGARMVETTIADETMLGGKAAEKASIGVMGRLLGSPFLQSRKLAQDLADNPFLLKKHMDETSSGPSVESLMGEHEGMMATALTGAASQYKKYKAGGGVMTDTEFQRRVGRQLSYPDPKAIPEVRAAADYHRTVYDADLAWAVNTGRLPDDVKTVGAAGYKPRLYDREKLLNKQAQFISLLSEHLYNGIKHGTLVQIEFRGSRMAIPATRVEALKRQNPGVIAVTSKSPNDTTMRNEAQGIAEEVHRGLVYHSPADQTVVGLVGPAGSLESRTIGLSDAALEPFLEGRADLVMKHYSREMSFDRAIFDKLGEHDLTDTLAKITEDAQRQVDKLPDGKPRVKMQKRLSQDITDLQALRDIVGRKYGRPENWGAMHEVGSLVRTYTDLTSLGGVALTSLPDLARVPMKYGLGPFMKGATRLLTGTAELSRSARTDIGIAIDRVTSGRLRSMADVSEDARRTGSASKIAGRAQELMFSWNLMNGWTDMMQSLSSEVFSVEAIRWMKSGTKKQKAMLARAGLDAEVSAKILKEYNESGSLDPRLWQDEEAAQYWGAALRNEMRHTIIEPGAGDLPLWMHTETGKFISKYKSFMVASHNKMLLAGLQQNDANFYSGLIFSFILAGAVAEGKDMIRAKDGPDTVFDKAFNTLSRTGALGVFEIPMTFGYQMAGGVPTRRISQGLTGNVTGATLGKAERTIRTVNKVLSPEEEAKTADLIRMIPFVNIGHFADLAERVVEN